VRLLGGAGSGKSTLLVDTAVAHIAAGLDPESVLLLTGSARLGSEARARITAALLRAGVAVASGTVLNTPCSSELTAAEAAAREARQGLWADPHAVRNARNSDDVRAASGRFALVEGTVLSARQAGATFYLNFGRRWTRDFAVTVPRHVKGLFDQSGVDLKALAGRRVRIRGWIEPRPVPRIELRTPGQVEILDHR